MSQVNFGGRPKNCGAVG